MLFCSLLERCCGQRCRLRLVFGRMLSMLRFGPACPSLSVPNEVCHVLLCSRSSQMSLVRCPRVLLGTTLRPISRSAFLALPQRPGMRGSQFSRARSVMGGDGACSADTDEQRQVAAAAAPATEQHPDEPHFKVVWEEQVHRRYLTLYNRSVQFPASSGQAEVRCCPLCCVQNGCS